MDETDEVGVPTVGERLRAAREEKGLSLEEIASQTRIPRRHLENLEVADWSSLPAPTYTIGFARSYASCVGLDRVEIADQLRSEMGGQRAASTTEVFEPADPARTMPKWLVFGAIAAVIALVLVMSWLSNRSLESDAADAPVEAAAPAATPVAPAAQPAGAVSIVANEQVWISVKDGAVKLKEGLLEAGQRFDVPPTATAPTLTTGKPEALRISVGTADAPPVGPAATTVTVSLLPADLMKGGQAAAPPAPAPAATAPAPVQRPRDAPRPRPRQSTATPPPVPAPEPAPATTNGVGE